MSHIIMLTGADGQLGFELQRALAPLGRVVALGRRQCDLADEVGLRSCVQQVQPSIIVNAAAYTAVDRAESEPELAYAVNATAPRILAEEASRTGAALLHYSTDYVFDGSAISPYTESDVTAPLGIYGASKLQGEREIEAVGAKHWIFRTSWVYGLHGSNFLKTMLRLSRQRESLAVVADQWGAPTSAALLADVSTLLLRDDCRGVAVEQGIYHVAAAGCINWHGYAQHVIARAAARNWAVKVSADAVSAIPSSAYPTPARRPLSSRLDCRRIEQALGIALPDWSFSVDQVTDVLMESHAL
ncbi:MAG: dTDP-4-dehydrorhamnose reductase [Moraxellaceae bacterium]|nr:dTDP-4-dehydrorhamnose reductase [Moraxellaceae bacterium]